MKLNSLCIVLGVGQLFCLFLALSGACSKQLQHQSLPTPFLTAMLAYAMMIVFYFNTQTLKSNIWLFFLSSLADVVGQVASIIAFQNTLISNVAILSVFGALSATSLSVLILKIKYSCIHYISFLLCLIGIFLKFLADTQSQKQTHSSSLYGDCMAALSALLYGTSSFISQYLVRQGNSNSVINFRYGLYGFIFTFILFFAFQEYKILSQNPVFISSYLLYAGYAVSGLLNYFFSIISIQIGGSTAYNLIGLSKVGYTMILDFFFFHSSFKFIDIIAYVLIMAGTALFYSKKPEVPVKEIQAPLLKIEGQNTPNSDL